MPWRGPAEPGEFPTLGHSVVAFVEAQCAIPDGEQRGHPYVLTDEMARFVLWLYRLDAHGKYVYGRGAQLVRPQKWGKGPFAAALICAEAQGPVVFAGWDAAGEPVGRPRSTAHIQVTAVSEDQADNVWRALVPMIELGSLGADIPDTGLTRVNLPGGGLIEPVTSSARSRLGQRITFAVQDETHSWTAHNGGRALADTQRRNLAGMGGRWLETTNAWDPREQSVAQQTAEAHEPGVYYDDVEPGAGSIRNRRDRRRMTRKVYGDSWWVDLDRIDEEIEALLPRDAPQAERFFLNRKRAPEAAAFELGKWDAAADVSVVVPDGSLVVVGIDGARFVDALAVIATDVVQAYQWVVGIWERPQDAGDDYEHPAHEIDGAVSELFERYEVWRCYVDPQWIDHLVDRWRGRWGATKVIAWHTNRPRQAAWMVRNYVAAVGAADLRHDGDSVMRRHISNAVRSTVNVYDDQHRQMWVLSKETPDSAKKIDGAVAGALSWEARGDAIAAGATAATKRKYRAAGF